MVLSELVIPFAAFLPSVTEVATSKPLNVVTLLVVAVKESTTEMEGSTRSEAGSEVVML